RADERDHAGARSLRSVYARVFLPDGFAFCSRRRSSASDEPWLPSHFRDALDGWAVAAACGQILEFAQLQDARGKVRACSLENHALTRWSFRWWELERWASRSAAGLNTQTERAKLSTVAEASLRCAT